MRSPVRYSQRAVRQGVEVSVRCGSHRWPGLWRARGTVRTERYSGSTGRVNSDLRGKSPGFSVSKFLIFCAGQRKAPGAARAPHQELYPVRNLFRSDTFGVAFVPLLSGVLPSPLPPQLVPHPEVRRERGKTRETRRRAPCPAASVRAWSRAALAAVCPPAPIHPRTGRAPRLGQRRQFFRPSIATARTITPPLMINW